MNPPEPIQDLRVIGYTGRLPGSMRPGYLAPVFQTQSGGILVAPYQVHTDFISGATILDKARFDELVDNRSIRIIDPHPALPDHWLWTQRDGILRYETKSRVERELKAIRTRHLELAAAGLREGKPQAAMTNAETAFAARASLETEVMLALCHERLGETELAAHRRDGAIDDGVSASAFDAVLNDQRERCQVPSTASPHKPQNRRGGSRLAGTGL